MMSSDSESASEFWISVVKTRLLPPKEDVHVSDDGEELARRRLDAEARGMVRALQVVQAQRNRFSPVSRLPLEVLGRIMSFAQVNEPPYRMQEEAKLDGATMRALFMTPVESTLPYRLGWISVSHVSQRWREAALRHPRLWTDVDFTRLPLAWIKEQLARTKVTPIFVIMMAYAKTSPTAIHAAVMLVAEPGVLARIQTIELIDSSHTGKFRAALKLFSHPAPALERLLLDPDVGAVPMDLPPDLFAGTAPRLAALRIGGIHAPYSLPSLLANLERFEMTLHPSTSTIAGPDPMPTPSQLQILIDSMPKLRVLRLQDVFLQGVPSAGDLTTDTIKLPASLQQLHLGGSFVACADFACRLDLPPTVVVTISLTGAKPGSPLMSSLLVHYGETVPPPVEIALSIGQEGQHHVVFDQVCARLGPAPYGDEEAEGEDVEGAVELRMRLVLRSCLRIPGQSLQASAIYSWTQHYSIHSKLVASFNDVLGAENLTTLHWTAHLYTGSDRNRKPIELIQELCPRPASLSPLDHVGQSSMPNSLPFPKLAVLRILEPPFTGRDHSRQHDTMFISALGECLRLRGALVQLELLVLPPRFKDEEWLGLLYPDVADVVFT